MFVSMASASSTRGFTRLVVNKCGIDHLALSPVVVGLNPIQNVSRDVNFNC